MSVVLLTVTDNTAPTIDITLQRNDVDINLTTATDVKLEIKNARTNTVTNTAHQTCTITSPVDGEVTYNCEIGDFPTAGRYLAEAKITYSGGDVEILHEQIVIIARSKY